jgi:hypothetical protein
MPPEKKEEKKKVIKPEMSYPGGTAEESVRRG